jgi:phage gp29-like protein
MAQDTSNERVIGGGRPVVPLLPSSVSKVEYADLIISQTDQWGLPETRAALAQHELGQFQQSSRLAEFMTRDDRISSCFNTRILGLQGLPFSIEPAESDNRRAKKRAESLKQIWQYICPPRVLEELLFWESFMGFCIAEIVWLTSGDRWVPQIKPYNPQFVFYNLSKRCYCVITADGVIDVTPGDGKWIFFSRHGEYRAWMRGAVRGLSLPWAARQFSWRDWGSLNEVYGKPIRQAVVPASAKMGDKKAFFQQIANLASTSVLMSPREYDAAGKAVGQFALELVECANSNNWESFERLMLRGDAAIQLILLGQNLSGGEIKGGSFAASKTAEHVREAFTQADAQLFSGELVTQVVRPWEYYAYGDNTLTPMPQWDASPPEDKSENAKTFLTVMQGLQIAKEMGVKVDWTRAAEKYALPIDASEDPSEPPTK